MNENGIVIAGSALILAAIIILVIIFAFSLLLPLLFPVMIFAVSILMFLFAFRTQNENLRIGWSVAGIIGFALLVAIFTVPNLFTLVDQPDQAQGFLLGRIQDFAATTNQDLEFKFSTAFGLGNVQQFLMTYKIDNGETVPFQYNFVRLEQPPNYPALDIIGQPVYSIPYNTLTQISGGKHTIEFNLLCPIGSCGADNDGDGLPDDSTQGTIFFEVWIDDPDCTNLGGLMEVIEPYSTGSTVSLQTLRWGHEAFCYQRPLRITDSQGVPLRQSLEEYALMINGSELTVPVGEVWLVTYIAQQTPDIPIVCPDGTAYDEANNQCVITPPVVFSCSQGLFDPVEQVCVVNPDVRMVCELGSYNTQEEKCVYFVPEDLTEIVCPAGSEITITPEGITKCVFEGTPEYVCNAGHLDTSVDPPICRVNATVETIIITLPIIGEVNLLTFVAIIIAIMAIIFSSIVIVAVAMRK